MKLIYTVLAVATLASAAPANPDVEKRALPAGCASVYWNTAATGGGWGCSASTNGVCTTYFWKTDPPYWSCN
ncbi:hypothetical protein BP5796_12033 [Coleophoma crateriformis]|uniref:CBM1 domain-containing protein n=1 Tax=Coleophoma crateriformis TaxID=565419 RepID=A0A3D8QBF9_9HELO|nr:hypothetical protein BP5796_12033 [Coleophoma crateriformis]